MSIIRKAAVLVVIAGFGTFFISKVPVIGAWLGTNSTYVFILSNALLLIGFGGLAYGYDKWRALIPAIAVSVALIIVAGFAGLYQFPVKLS